MEEVITILLYNQRGEVTGRCLVDHADADLVADSRWYLSKGYPRRTDHGVGRRRHTLMHRLVLGMRPGDGLWVDHINRDKLDNRRANLRIVTPAQSAQNLPAIGGASKFRGVWFNRRTGRWNAGVQFNRRAHHLGAFDTEAEAAAAASRWRAENMPFAVET